MEAKDTGFNGNWDLSEKEKYLKEYDPTSLGIETLTCITKDKDLLKGMKPQKNYRACEKSPHAKMWECGAMLDFNVKIYKQQVFIRATSQYLPQTCCKTPHPF